MRKARKCICKISKKFKGEKMKHSLREYEVQALMGLHLTAIFRGATPCL
jgi:hypothetical protein